MKEEIGTLDSTSSVIFLGAAHLSQGDHSDTELQLTALKLI